MKRASKIGLGSVQFGTPYGISNSTGQTGLVEVKKILALAHTAGIEIIDTASGYGEAETVLGHASVDGFRVVSKFMPCHTHGPAIEQLKRTLQKLKLSRLYGYLAHRPSECLTDPRTWKELQALKSEGLIQKIGFSFNEPAEINACLDKGMFPDLIQVPYNYFDNRFAKDLKDLKNQGCEIHTRSAFLQGLFFTDTDRLDSFFSPVNHYIKTLQDTYGQSLPHRLLDFVCRQEFIDRVIIGVENADQLASNLKFTAVTDSLPVFSDVLPAALLMPMNWPKNE